jgi:hypothetical protein
VSRTWPAFKPYLEKESLAAFFVGISSGFPYAMLGATLTTRLAQDGIDKKTITAFALAFLVYNLKVFWAWIVDGVRIPLLGRLGQRVSWLLLAGFAVMAAGGKNNSQLDATVETGSRERFFFNIAQRGANERFAYLTFAQGSRQEGARLTEPDERFQGFFQGKLAFGPSSDLFLSAVVVRSEYGEDDDALRILGLETPSPVIVRLFTPPDSRIWISSASSCSSSTKTCKSPACEKSTWAARKVADLILSAYSPLAAI